MYEIIIKRTVDATKLIGRDWVVIGQKEDGRPEYAYTPEDVKSSIEIVDVYTQKVDDLNLIAVIAAVNGTALDSTK